MDSLYTSSVRRGLLCWIQHDDLSIQMKPFYIASFASRESSYRLALMYQLLPFFYMCTNSDSVIQDEWRLNLQAKNQMFPNLS